MWSIRSNAILVCEKHGCRLFPTMGRYHPLFRCEQYEREHREKASDPVCNNYITLKEKEALYSRLEYLWRWKTLKEGDTGVCGKVRYTVGTIGDIVLVKIWREKKMRTMSFDEYDELTVIFDKVRKRNHVITCWPSVAQFDRMEQNPDHWLEFCLFLYETNPKPETKEQQYSKKNLQDFIHRHLELVE